MALARQAEAPELALQTTGCYQPVAGGRHVPALLLRSGVGDTTKRKKTQNGSGQLAIRRRQKSPTCEATHCITWQSGRTTRPGPAPPAPQSTSQPKSHVSVCEGGGLLPGRVSASQPMARCQALSSLKELPDGSLSGFYAEDLPAAFPFARLFPALSKQSMQNPNHGVPEN